MFKVKATVVGFLGDEEKYPCHFSYNIGDEFVYDGEKFIGRVCEHVLPMLIPKFDALYAAGPRYVEPAYHYPFWYAPLSVADPAMKKYDGLGFRPVKQAVVEPPYHLASLIPPDAFRYPPLEERIVLKDIMVICPDYRTSASLKVEAFDLAALGDAVPYFRKQMLILSKVLPKQGIEVKKIRDEFSKVQREEIYPLLAPVMLQALVEELELVGYLDIQNGRAHVTKKGEAKLEDFEANLSEEERKALELQPT